MKLLDVKEIAEVLNVKSSTLYQWAEKGISGEFYTQYLIAKYMSSILIQMASLHSNDLFLRNTRPMSLEKN